jgi:hypothetical protein
MSHALTEKAMIANLRIGHWQGHRLDKAASDDVIERAGAKAGAARVNKHLVAKEFLAPIITASGAVRTHFYEKTLPWRDNGDRILSRKLYMSFIETHEGLVREFEDAVEKFLTVDYPSAVEQAEFRMGELFNPDDYPPAAELRRRFYIALDFDAVTTSNDFRVQIDAAHVEQVKASMDAAAETRLAQAQGDVWKRIASTIGYFHERMADPDKVFRDTTVSNVHELLDLIPGLNILDDPEIEEVRGMIAKSLGAADAGEIRKHADVREELAADAQAILDKMAGFARAFGGDVKEAA